MIRLINENGRVYEILKTVMLPGEEVKMTMAERRMGGARWIDPAHAFATNRQIIIIRGGVFHVYQDIKIINYHNITEIKLEHGIRFSRLHFTLQGESVLDRNKWLVGLEYREALQFIRLINEMEEKPVREQQIKDSRLPFG